MSKAKVERRFPIGQAMRGAAADLRAGGDGGQGRDGRQRPEQRQRIAHAEMHEEQGRELPGDGDPADEDDGAEANPAALPRQALRPHRVTVGTAQRGFHV
jgi:hypothetical protein